MVSMRDYYARVNAAWPKEVPLLTDAEAIKACRKLFRFCKMKTQPVETTTGNRHSWGRWSKGRYVFFINTEQGWHRLVHNVSHWAYYVKHQSVGERGHNKNHARLELRLIKQVVRRGWLQGKLKRPEPAAKPEPSRTEQQSSKLTHARAMLRRAETRLKRATTIHKKWARRLKRLTKETP